MLPIDGISFKKRLTMSNLPAKINPNLIGYQDLMNSSDWSKLHPSIQRRFSVNLYESVVYQGKMREIYLSFAGKLLAQCCRLIGNPLALYSGKDVPVRVKVYANNQLGGMTWDRFYQYKNKPTNRVKSTKCKDDNGQLVEMVGFGFGMELDVFERNQAITFESQRFFWKFKKLNITIPDWLSPGKTTVSQQALNNHQFEFQLDVTHKFLGKVFKQIGVFEAV
ncbi:MAG: DUF4166 domain-containing protein [Kangiellaceae bacterium]